METRATIKHLRISARKVRLAADFIKGLDVIEAREQLRFSTKSINRPILKLLNSAIANGEKNHEMDKNNLYIKDVIINEGATLKRFQPRAFGRAGTIRKRSSHVTLVLAEKKPRQIKKKPAKKTKKTEPEKILSYDELKKQAEPEKDRTSFNEQPTENKPGGRFTTFKDKFIRRTGKK